MAGTAGGGRVVWPSPDGCGGRFEWRDHSDGDLGSSGDTGISIPLISLM